MVFCPGVELFMSDLGDGFMIDSDLKRLAEALARTFKPFANVVVLGTIPEGPGRVVDDSPEKHYMRLRGVLKDVLVREAKVQWLESKGWYDVACKASIRISRDPVIDCRALIMDAYCDEVVNIPQYSSSSSCCA